MQSTAPPPMSMEEFRSYLHRHSLKATPQRLAVHGAMMKLGHASADMIDDEIRKEGTARVTVASVYNILTSLADKGLYSRRLSSNNKMYFDVNNFPHIHLYDTVNNTYRDVFDDELMTTVKDKLRKHKWKGFRVDDIDIQILCHPSRSYRKVTEK